MIQMHDSKHEGKRRRGRTVEKMKGSGSDPKGNFGFE